MKNRDRDRSFPEPPEGFPGGPAGRLTPGEDPRLTAYALGELDRAEARAVEAWIESDPRARARLQEVRETAGLLRRQLAGEPAPALSRSQREAIEKRCAGGPVEAVEEPTEETALPGMRGRDWAAAALAASLIFMALVWSLRDEQAPTDLALQRADDGQTPAPTEVAGVEVARVEDLGYSDGNDLRSTLDGLGYSAGSTGGSSATDPPPGKVLAPRNSLPSPNRSGEAEQLRALMNGTGGRSAGEVLATSAADPSTRFAMGMGERKGAGPEFEGTPATVPPAAGIEPLSEWSGQHLFDWKATGIHPAPVLRFLRDDVRPYRTGHESYQRITENPFVEASRQPLSTFSIDVDTASYANVRRFLSHDQRPPRDAVRIEELVNYFPYDYASPEGEHPFAVHVEVGQAPWNSQHRLVRVGLKGQAPRANAERFSNLVFLVDVSGSMNQPNKLPLVKDSLRMLARGLSENDSVAIVVYASSSGLVLPATHGEDREAILGAIDNLRAGGSTNGGQGIQLAYRVAREHFIPGGINRVMLATDGDFNVGITDDGSLERLIADEAESGVYLTVLGFGDGNLKDSKLEILSGRGNGNYAYIDGLREARKVLVDEISGTLETIAKDVKLQVDFNPAQVLAYRLIGYENRMLAARDFADDRKDAGEIGAGHTVTALYEVVPAHGTLPRGVEPSKYVSDPEPAPAPPALSGSGELLTVRLRYKLPEASHSTRFDVPVTDQGLSFEELSADSRFAASVAAFGMILRGSAFRDSVTLEAVASWALESRGEDPGGYRAEFCDLVGRARRLAR